MMGRVLGAATVAVALVAWSAASAPAAPVDLGPGVKVVGTQELKGWLDQKKDLVLVNALSAVEFRDKTIPGSINVPAELWEEGRVSLPAAKEALLVFF